MASITITLADTPAGGISIHSDFKPAVGNPCSAAQAAALDIIRRTRKEYGLADPASKGTALATVPTRTDGVDIDAIHRQRDNVVNNVQGVDVGADRLNMHFTSGAADALQNSDRRFFAVEDRRPGLYELAEKLALENPIWSRERCMRVAKARYTVTPVLNGIA